MPMAPESCKNYVQVLYGNYYHPSACDTSIYGGQLLLKQVGFWFNTTIDYLNNSYVYMAVILILCVSHKQKLKLYPPLHAF